MTPEQRKAQDRIKKVIKQLEDIETYLNYIIVIIVVLSTLQYATDYANDEAVHILHLIGGIFLGLKLALFLYLLILGIYQNKYRLLPGVIKVVTDSTALKLINVSEWKISNQSGTLSNWRYAISIEDFDNIAALDVEMGNSESLLARCHYYKELHKTRNGLTAMMHSNDALLGSGTFLPLANNKNFNNRELPINENDILPDASNTVFMASLTFNYHHIDAIHVRSWMAMLCYQIASVACTHDGTYTDIIIYARISEEQEVLRKILKAMGFTPEPRKNDNTIMVLKFSDKPGNVYVQKIVEFMRKQGK